MGLPRYSADEIVACGKAIYEQRLKSKLEPQNRGKFLVIDIETGDYEIDEDDLTASRRAARKRPDEARFGMRIGSPTAGTLGGAALRGPL